MQAVGYARWSSLEQSRGSSLERQTEYIRSLCDTRGWTLLEQVTDEGQSAYTGANIHTGNLAKLIRRIELGELDRQIVIVVEQLDRISRLPPSQVVSWIQRVTALGVSIATANDGQIIDSRLIDSEPMSFMTLVFNSFRAYQESKHKSERLSESWRIRRSKIGEHGASPATTVCPAWLEFNRQTKRFEVVEDRVQIVNEIFRRTAEGEGKRVIAQDLNRRGVEPWGRGGSKANGWHPSYIQKILRNAAVMGEYQPCTKARSDPRRVPVGDPIPNYYPPVVPEGLWAKVQSIRPAKRGNDGLRGDVSNLFSGLARCRSCGGRMAFQLKHREGTRTRQGKAVAQARMSYLFCDTAARGLRCDHDTYYRYEKLEGGFLDCILRAALTDSFFSDEGRVARLSEEQFKAVRLLEQRRSKVGRLLDLYTETGDATVRERWMAENARLTEAERAVSITKAELSRSQGRVSPQEHIDRVAGVRAQIDDPDLEVRRNARTLVAKSLREVIDEISFETGGIVMLLRDASEAILFTSDGDIKGSVAVLPAFETSTDAEKLALINAAVEGL